MLVCKLKLRKKKNDENFQSIFRVGFFFLKLKLRFAEKGKVEKRNVGVMDVPLVGRHVD